jgi:hypothetical protein
LIASGALLIKLRKVGNSSRMPIDEFALPKDKKSACFCTTIWGKFKEGIKEEILKKIKLLKINIVQNTIAEGYFFLSAMYHPVKAGISTINI